MLRTSLPLLILSMFLTFQACAQKANYPPTSKTRFLDATVQRTIPGLPNMEPTTDWKFLLIWKETRAPKTFLWQPAGGKPLVCAVQKVHHYSKPGGQQLEAYSSKAIALKNVRRGDTLELIPVPNRPGTLPKSLKPVRQDALYYQFTGSNSWRYLKPALRPLKDIVMQ